MHSVLSSNKISRGTDYEYYRELLDKAHTNLVTAESDRVLDRDTIDKIEADPTFAETLPNRRGPGKNPKYPCIYHVKPEHVDDVRVKECMSKLGVSSRTVREIRIGNPISFKSVTKLRTYLGLTLKELVTPENYAVVKDITY